MARLTRADWIAFFASGVPLIDWHYAITNKKTKVELVLFPVFCKRPRRENLIATAEHLLYFIISFAAVKLVGIYYSAFIALIAIGGIVPLEFYFFRKLKFKYFKNLRTRLLAVTAIWNMFNVTLYWIAGSIVGLF